MLSLHAFRLPAAIAPYLAGIAIGNGLTDPRSQVPVMSEAAHYMGLVSPALRQDIARRSQEVLAAIDAGHWREAHDKREVGGGG